jgi:hypothetical protein
MKKEINANKQIIRFIYLSIEIDVVAEFSLILMTALNKSKPTIS